MAAFHSVVGARDGLREAEDAPPLHVRKVLLACGLVDEPPDLPGYRALWGHAVFQCPYCHGYEHRDQRWALHAQRPMHFDFALLLTGWTRDLIVFIDEGLEVPAEMVDALVRAGVTLGEDGFVTVTPLAETSVPGVYAAGDLTTSQQGAVFSAAAGAHAGAMMNLALNVEAASNAGA